MVQSFFLLSIGSIKVRLTAKWALPHDFWETISYGPFQSISTIKMATLLPLGGFVDLENPGDMHK